MKTAARRIIDGISVDPRPLIGPAHIETTWELVGPDRARRWLESNHESNRKIDRRRVRKLAMSMKNNHWKVSHQGICLDTKGRLIDGQHRLAAIMESNTQCWFMVTKNCPDASFAAFDGDLRKRTLAQRGKISGRDNKDGEYALANYALRTLMGRECFPIAEQTFALIDAFPDEFAITMEQTKYDPDKVRTGTCGFRFATLLGNLVDASAETNTTGTFVEQVTNGECLEKYDPAWTYRRAMLNKQGHRRVGSDDVFDSAARCLCAEFDNEELRHLRPSESHKARLIQDSGIAEDLLVQQILTELQASV